MQTGTTGRTQHGREIQHTPTCVPSDCRLQHKVLTRLAQRTGPCKAATPKNTALRTSHHTDKKMEAVKLQSTHTLQQTPPQPTGPLWIQSYWKTSTHYMQAKPFNAPDREQSPRQGRRGRFITQQQENHPPQVGPSQAPCSHASAQTNTTCHNGAIHSLPLTATTLTCDM